MSDLDKFEARAFERGSGHTNDDVPGLDLPGGLQTLHTLANVLKSWPLARLTIPLSGFSKQLERLLEGYCMEVSVTNSSRSCNYTMSGSLPMAEKISSLLRQVLDHSSKVLHDTETEALFLPLFWFYPIYRVRSPWLKPGLLVISRCSVITLLPGFFL